MADHLFHKAELKDSLYFAVIENQKNLTDSSQKKKVEALHQPDYLQIDVARCFKAG